MYFTYKNNFFHGIMFHHLHNKDKHIKGQGSISGNQFKKIINFIGKDNIISPEKSLSLIKNKNNIYRKKINKVCLTFDDALKCQIDVALPILNKLKLKAFFFVYSGIYSEKPELLEIHRYFRVNYFKNIDDFYKNFFDIIINYEPNIFLFIKSKQKLILENKKKFPFYSINDLKFRLVRDQFLSISDYNNYMQIMFKIYNFQPKKILDKLFMTKSDIKHLINNGHYVGLHSHSHPTFFESLTLKEQEKEYKDNINFLKSISNRKNKFVSVAHPCGSYSYKTLQILNKLKIKIAFKNYLDNNFNNSKFKNLEIHRENHSLILKKIKNIKI
tara:strand:- start:4455 stop:5441 length:987 start_codon:yes stop_codon:yes gene_type:complete